MHFLRVMEWERRPRDTGAVFDAPLLFFFLASFSKCSAVVLSIVHLSQYEHGIMV